MMSESLICDHCSGEIDLSGIVCPHCEELCYFVEINNWIPCSERLPEPGERVLMCLNDVAVFEGYLSDSGWKRNEMPLNVLFGDDFIVSRWQPLPQPPKTESEV